MTSTSIPASALRHVARRLFSASPSPRVPASLGRTQATLGCGNPPAKHTAGLPRPHSTDSAGPCSRLNGIPTKSQDSAGFSTVNQTEVSHFDALAATWWDTHGSSRLLHLMNPLRHDFIRDCHASVPGGASQGVQGGQQDGRLLRYLDVGCGGGIFAESAARLPSVSSVTALDASTSVLAVAREHLRRETTAVQRKLAYLHSSVEALAAQIVGDHDSSSSGSSESSAQEPDGRFDVVTAFEVLEHVENPSAFLERCGALVRPGGWLVLSTIARTWVSWATTIFAAEDVLGIVPRGTHDWRKYVDADELRAWFDSRPTAEGWAGPSSFSRCQGVVYVPGLGWRAVPGSEKVGNYFFGVRKSPAAS